MEEMIAKSLLALGPAGLVIAVLVYLLFQSQKDLKEERKSRFEETQKNIDAIREMAEKHTELLIDHQEKIINLSHLLAEVARSYVDARRNY